MEQKLGLQGLKVFKMFRNQLVTLYSKTTTQKHGVYILDMAPSRSNSGVSEGLVRNPRS